MSDDNRRIKFLGGILQRRVASVNMLMRYYDIHDLMVHAGSALTEGTPQRFTAQLHDFLVTR